MRLRSHKRNCGVMVLSMQDSRPDVNGKGTHGDIRYNCIYLGVRVSKSKSENCGRHIFLRVAPNKILLTFSVRLLVRSTDLPSTRIIQTMESCWYRE